MSPKMFLVVHGCSLCTRWRLASLGNYPTQFPFFLCLDCQVVLRGFHNLCRHRASQLSDKTWDGDFLASDERERLQYFNMDEYVFDHTWIMDGYFNWKTGGQLRRNEGVVGGLQEHAVMAETRPLPRNRVKTRTGCLRCKQRRIKCDETYPHCDQCTRRAYDCPGYQRPLKWSSKYEVAANNDAATRKDARSKPTTNALTRDLTVDTLSSILSPSALASALTPQHLPMSTGLAEHNASLYAASPDASFPEFEFNNITPQQYEQTSSSFPDFVQLSDDFDTNMGDCADFSVPLPLEDQDTRISRHYFFHVCRINSCFDSGTNPMRVQIYEQMASGGLIYHCVLSMSAAHEGNIGSTALTHRSKAMTCLKSELAQLKEGTDSGKLLGSTTDLSSALLGCILLGMTDAWHHPSNLGLTHLHGARALFKRWISITGTNDGTVTASPQRDFLVGIMVYWESLASFFTSQSLDALAYLDAFCGEGIRTKTQIHPNPWAGVCTPLFVYLAKAGTLARQRSLAKNFSNQMAVPSATNIQAQLIADLTGHARRTETALLQYEIPARDRIRETADHLTPISHLQKMAQIYRLVALLEIYRNFPSLLRTESNTTLRSATQKQDTERPLENSSCKDKLLTMATAILTLIMGLPRTSGVNCVLTIPLVIAGSTLQPVKPSFTAARQAERENGDEGSYQTGTAAETATAWNSLLAPEILSISAQEETRLYWRDLVRERIRAVHSYVGLASVTRALDILENVWARADFQAIAADREAEMEFVQWTEVMVGEKLETILG
ncbi:fungal-specific transcription factor domain-containing protein [Aspergillus similis]